jgi:hypothetical protein
MVKAFPKKGKQIYSATIGTRSYLVPIIPQVFTVYLLKKIITKQKYNQKTKLQ